MIYAFSLDRGRRGGLSGGTVLFALPSFLRFLCDLCVLSIAEGAQRGPVLLYASVEVVRYLESLFKAVGFDTLESS